jgi:hypothetical protein
MSKKIVVKRRSKRKATIKKTKAHVRKQYLKNHKGLARTRKKPAVYTPCLAPTVTYNVPWPPSIVAASITAISFSLAGGLNTKPYVESLGERGAKWYVCTQLLGKTIEDGDMSSPFKAGYFYSFSGAYTFDCVYVDNINGHVYVIEAKGTQYGSAAHLITRVSGNVQGSFLYLDEVVQDMNASGDAHKQAASNAILTVTVGKLHYVGVHTTYSVDMHGKVTAQQPNLIFNISR